MKKFNCFLVLMVFSVLLSAQEIPLKISYQGKLLESGAPVSGTKSMTFTIGTWTETHSNVEVNEGLYSVTLGSIIPIQLTFATVRKEKETYLDIKLVRDKNFDKNQRLLDKLIISDNTDITDADFKKIREKPIYKEDDETYRVIYDLFFIGKFQ